MQSENVHSDRDLLLRIAEGDTTAFRAMYDSYYSRLCFFARSITEDLPDAEDLVQEVFIRIWGKREELPSVQFMKTYLYASVRNAALDYLKSRQKLSLRQEELRHTVPVSYFPEEAALVREEVLQQVILEIEALPEKYRNVLTLLYVDGKSYREISEILQMPEATIRKQKERAVGMLQSVLIKNKLSASLVYSPYFIFLLKFVTKG